MKILCIKKGTIDTDILNKGIASTYSYASSIGLELDFWFVDSGKQFTSIPVVNNIILDGHIVNPTEILAEAKASKIPFDACLLIYSWLGITPQPTNPDDGGMILQIPIQWYQESKDVLPEQVFAEYLLHELSHYFAGYFGVVDKTHLKYDSQWNGQFSQKSNIDYYLFLMKPLIVEWNKQNPAQPLYKYFRLTESTGGGHTVAELSPILMKKLDIIRGQCGFPFIINSGMRSQAQNDVLQCSVKDSSHILGLAVDVRCNDDTQRLKIVNTAQVNGITRIGIGNGFVHLDMDSNKTQNCCWTYY